MTAAYTSYLTEPTDRIPMALKFGVGVAIPAAALRDASNTATSSGETVSTRSNRRGRKVVLSVIRHIGKPGLAALAAHDHQAYADQLGDHALLKS